MKTRLYAAYTECDGEKEYFKNREQNLIVVYAEDEETARKKFEEYARTKYFNNTFNFMAALAECPIYVEEV